MSKEKKPRRIQLETRHGSSRESRSRRDRPCDVCRSRKSACVIAVKPPCRFCELRGLECTFATTPRPRRRPTTASAEDNSATNGGPTVDEDARNLSYDKLSPQDLRFPVPSATLRRDSDNPFAWQPSSESPSGLQPHIPHRQYLSLEQLISPTSQLAPQAPNAAILPPQSQDVRTQALYNAHRSKNSLEHGEDTTAHFVGLSGEQDLNIFSSIRYNILNETNIIDFKLRQVYAGNPIQGTPPIHFSILHDVFPDHDNRAKREASEAIESLVGEHADTLLRLYFRFVHPIFPILSKTETITTYAKDKLKIPASLRGVIYGLATAFWAQDSSLNDVPLISQAELFEHVHAALYRELDSPKLSTLQACLLVLHQQPDAAGTTESPRIWALACQATACAQILGLHRDPSSWKLPMWEKRLRRKLWWATWATDRWTSICHGNTPHICPDSFDTKDLDINDLVEDEDIVGLAGEEILPERDRVFDRVNALRWFEVMKLTKILDLVLKDGFTLASYRDTIQVVDTTAREAAIWQLKIKLDQLEMLLPPSLALNNSSAGADMNSNGLHLAFFAAKFLTLRALMAPATPEAKSNPNSKLCHHFETALVEGEAFVAFASRLTLSDLHVFWYRHSRTNLIISGNFLIYLFFCASSGIQVAKAYDMLHRYHDYIVKLAKVSDWSTIGLIRPTLLRMESFFHGAAEGIRLAGRK